jgi:hypothetical protein
VKVDLEAGKIFINDSSFAFAKLPEKLMAILKAKQKV